MRWPVRTGLSITRVGRNAGAVHAGRVSLSLKKDPFAAKNFDKSNRPAGEGHGGNNKKPHDNRQSAKDYERNKRDDFSSVEIKFGKLR